MDTNIFNNFKKMDNFLKKVRATAGTDSTWT